MKKGLLLILTIVFALNLNAQILSEDFETTPGELPAGWMTVSPTYATAAFTWYPASFSGNNYLRASSWNGANNATEQWVITPAFSTTDLTNLQLAFDNDRADYAGPDVQVFVSTDFAGDSASFASATWTEVTGLSLSTGAYTVVNNVSDISFAAGNANVYVAFKYTSTDTEGAVWDIDNVVISSTTGISEISDNFNVFPNPVVSDLNISSKINIKNITVSNVIGQKVLNISNINADNYTLNVADLTKGVYLVNIENIDGTSIVTKIVKR